MINMKRLISVFFTFAILGMLCFFSIRKKDVLPKITFPLEEETIITALEKSGLPGILSESETYSLAEGQRVHAVRSPTITYSDTVSTEEANADPSTRLLIASISSAAIEGERVLFTVFDQIDVSDPISWEDWKQQLVFAALLYGGFEDDEEVYRAFADKEIPYGEDAFGRWDAQLPGGYCMVTYRSFAETSKPVQKRHIKMTVNIYESPELYQKLQEPAA